MHKYGKNNEGLFEPSVIGNLYKDFSQNHLIGKWLSPPEISAAFLIMKKYNLNDWKIHIKSFEYDMLFYISMIINSLGDRELAADMIQFAYINGYGNNFIIQSLIDKKIDKNAIIQQLNNISKY